MEYDINRIPYKQRHWLMQTSNIPHRFIGMGPNDVAQRLGEFSDEIIDWLDDVIDGKVIKTVGGLGTTGVGLLFDGDAGLGKTTHSVICLTELIRRIEDDEQAKNIFQYQNDDCNSSARPIYYMTVPDFINRKKAMIDAEPDAKREMQMYMEGFHGRSALDHLNVRVLVLDDLGKEPKSEYNAAGFDELLRSRYDKGLPTIVTTNLDRSKWAAKYGDAMGSFVYEAFKRVIIGDKDLRRN